MDPRHGKGLGVHNVSCAQRAGILRLRKQCRCGEYCFLLGVVERREGTVVVRGCLACVHYLSLYLGSQHGTDA